MDAVVAFLRQFGPVTTFETYARDGTVTTLYAKLRYTQYATWTVSLDLQLNYYTARFNGYPIIVTTDYHQIKSTLTTLYYNFPLVYLYV